MTHQVRILPSGHEFIAEGHSSLLEAGLRAGLRLGYGCSNGKCGECLAKVVSGEVVIRFQDRDLKDVIISHSGVMDLASRRGVTVDSIRNSNLRDLVQKRIIEVL